MTNFNDNTAHDFYMYYPKGQNGNILNTNSKSEKKEKNFTTSSCHQTKNRVMRLESLGVVLLSFPGTRYCSPERKDPKDITVVRTH